MGHPAISLLVSLVAAYASAIAIYPALRRRSVLAVSVIAVAGAGIAACLFFIPGERPELRAVAAIFCTDLLFRVIDFKRQSWRGNLEAVGWSEYCRFLIPFPILLVVFGQKERLRRVPHNRGLEVLRLLLGAAGVVLGFLLIFAAERNMSLQSSFLLDHVTKIPILVLTAESLAQGLCALERLAGFHTPPIIDRAYLAHTPAQFWSRWNNRVNAWLYSNAFVPAGGRRAPMRGIWAAFLISAVHHEIFFTLATSRFTGYQFTFFLLQAPAVIISPALERLARASPIGGTALAYTATLLWLAGTSIFFFHGVDRVFPFFYASEPWLP